MKASICIISILSFQVTADMNHVRRLVSSSSSSSSSSHTSNDDDNDDENIGTVTTTSKFCTNNCDLTNHQMMINTTTTIRDLTEVTYYPGDLMGGYRVDLGLTLSRGLNGKRLTTGDKPVTLSNGGVSMDAFHPKADGACTIPKANGDGWYYVSNSEVRDSGTVSSFPCSKRSKSHRKQKENSSGGVGAIEFNSAGEIVGYQRVLMGTSGNCGGGRTYWGTWVSCEENGQDGRLYEVDPNTGFTQQIQAVDQGGNYESFAFDDQDPDVPARFYITEDAKNGALIQYTPAPSAFLTGNPYNILNSSGGSFTYLVFQDDGTYVWSSNRDDGERSAERYYPYAEGMDIWNRQLFFTSKERRILVQVDLTGNTYTITSTVSGQFDLDPDQLSHILDTSGSSNPEVLYFCEDGGSDSDIHGRDSTGKYFTVIEGTDFDTETTGLAFSPDGRFMYVAFQDPSAIFAFWREDGLAFSGTVAGTKYHGMP